MSLDNIQLPALVLHDLFKNSLVDLNTDNAVLSPEKAGTLVFLGGNQHKVAILVCDPEALHLSDQSLNFLLGILSACKLSMADVALLNCYKQTVGYELLEEQLGAEKILLFGIGAEQLSLPLQFPNYQSQKYNGRIYLAAPELPVIEQDKSEKMKLWNCLKSIFPG